MTETGRGAIGPVIGVLAVILVLGVISVIIGRLCSGRSVFGYGHYDFEGWIERKCGPCIDGRIDHPRPAMPDPPPISVSAVPMTATNWGRAAEAKERGQAAGAAES